MNTLRTISAFSLISGIFLTGCICPDCEHPVLPYTCNITENDLWTYEGEWDEEERAVADELAGLEQEIYALINQERHEKGVCLLQIDNCVWHTARLHSEEMAVEDYCGHEDSSGGRVYDRLTNNGIPWKRSAENIVCHTQMEGMARFIVDKWLESPGHRETILDGRYTYTGVGVACDEEGNYYATQVFVSY